VNLMQHTQQVGSAATRRIYNRKSVKLLQQLARFWNAYVIRGTVVDQYFVDLQSLLQGFAAHERYDRPRCVVPTRFLSRFAFGHKLLKDFAKHLRIDGNLNVEWCRLFNCEVIPFEQRENPTEG